MVQWMDRETTGFTHMGGEGANWVGEAPFSKRDHVFQNLGDGTYNHSGIQAIRFALSAGTNITYKILYNDAVAMTGGQSNEGGLDPYQIVAELKAMGVRNVGVVYDAKEEPDLSRFPKDVALHERADLSQVQRTFAASKGVSALVYIQTCAAEKRRRRKRGQFPDPDQRVFINTDVCEGCGDCGVQSNCVSIVPVETDLGRKRSIDQSSCNKDFSCVNGFCPSFVTVEGATPRKAATIDVETGDLPMPTLPAINGTHNTVITGVGGTGVVTIGAVMAMAAHLDEKGTGLMEMAGLAQKGGAVHIHCRISNSPGDISAIRIATGEADTLIGGDLVVSAGEKTLGLMRVGETGAVVNTHEIITGEFTRDTEFRLPTDRLQLALTAKFRERLTLFDASNLSRSVLGDTIFSNMILFGAAWQLGMVPLTHEAITKAVALNGAAPERNLRAFEIGRWAALNPERAAQLSKPNVVALPKTLEEMIAYRAAHLENYQSRRLASRYRAFVDRFEDPRLKEAVAKGYHKLLSYKDEYEVARLHLETEAKARAAFEGDLKLHYHLAPPLLSKIGADGRPKKRRFGPGMARGFKLLAKLKWLRGTPLDPFGYTAERRMERALITQYERDMSGLHVTEETLDVAVALAELPLQIRGFGPVKAANEAKAAKQRETLLPRLRSGSAALAHAAE